MGFGEGYKGSHECVGSFEKWLILTKYLHGYRSCTKGPNIFLELWVSDLIQSPVCGSGGLRGQEAGLRGRTPPEILRDPRRRNRRCSRLRTTWLSSHWVSASKYGINFAVCQSFRPCGVCAGLNSFRVQGKLYARIHEVTKKYTSASVGVSSPPPESRHL